MFKGSQLVSEDVWPENQNACQLPHWPVALRRAEIESLSVEMPPDVQERMEHLSQIGLKNQYLGKTTGHHNRWNHVKGVYTLGLIWLHSLYSSDAIPAHLKAKPYLDYETVRIILGYCFLLHDYGHLPFSHLLEEALHAINWVPIESGQNSLEYTVLRDRLGPTGVASPLLKETIVRTLPFSAPLPIREDPLTPILQLTHGWGGMCWLQAIVNSPIDADKIDYLGRDQRFLQEAGFPIQTRLALSSKTRPDGQPWFNEFLCDQFVNHAGLLCLQGRSAVAAIDLWCERLLLYERFYLSPVIRAADRITLEVVQQFLIRAVMSESFGSQIAKHPLFAKATGRDDADVKDLASLVQTDPASGNGGIDVISVKYRAVTRLLNRLSLLFGHTSDRDWECYSFMRDLVLQVPSTNQQYRELLESATEALKELKNSKDVSALFSFADSFIVESPIQFHRDHFKTVGEIVRSFQHQYFADVFIDLHIMPRVLSIPPAPRSTPRLGSPHFDQMLVPKGPAEKWSSGSCDLEPLTPAKVKSLERPFGRILVLSPPDANRAKARYIFHRLLAELRQKQVLYEEVEYQ